jgi:hypothetical protein
MSDYFDPDDFSARLEAIEATHYYGNDDSEDPVDPLVAEWEQNPVALQMEMAQRGAEYAASELRQEIAAQQQQQAAERAGLIVRDADEAMLEKYGGEWRNPDGSPTELGERVAVRLTQEITSGRAPVEAQHDALAAAQWWERTFLAERELARPTREEQERAAWERVKEQSDSDYASFAARNMR